MNNIVSERFALAWSELEWSRDCGLADSDEGRLDDWSRSLQVTVGGKRSGWRCVDWLAVGAESSHPTPSVVVFSSILMLLKQMTTEITVMLIMLSIRVLISIFKRFQVVEN